MKLLRGLMVVTLVLVMVAPVFADKWFGFSEEEYAACNQKYLGNAEGSFDDYMAIDLSRIENKTDAKMLHKQFSPMVELIEEGYEELEVRSDELKVTVKRLFGILYTKEVHDELWESTRPLKQAAYKKVLTEYNVTYETYRTTGTTLFQAQAIEDALKDISRQFKELDDVMAALDASTPGAIR